MMRNSIPTVSWLSIIAILHACDAHAIDVGECGQSKGCLQEPGGCEADNCEFLLTWKAEQDSVFFEMSARADSSNSYVAFGLSHDNQMGSDSVIGCLDKQTTDRVDIEASWNVASARNNQPLSDPKVGIVASGQTASRDGDRITCSFSRLKHVNDPNNQVYPIDNTTQYYILMARGQLSGDNRLRVHTNRIASKEPVDLTNTTDVSGDSGETKKTLIQVHGILMVTAWCIFASFGILMPRYYKPAWFDKTWCGKAIWFQIHMPCMIITLLITAAAFIIIFVAVEGYSQLPSPGVAHPPLGICVMALVLINPIMAIFRPAPDAGNRWIFNMFHFTVGFLAQLASATTVFLGLWQFGLEDWCMIIMAALVAFHMLIELILIIHKNAKVLCKCCCKEERNGEDIAMHDLSEPRTQKSSTGSQGSDIFQTVIMFVHLFGVVAFSVILMVKIGMHEGPQRGPGIVSTIEA